MADVLFASSLAADADFAFAMANASDGIEDSLDSYYRLEAPSGTRYDLIATDDLADVNTVGQTTGKIGNAASLVRVNGETLQAANDTVHDFGDEDFTIAFWGSIVAKVGNAQTFVSKFRPTTNRQYFVDYVSGGTDRFRFLVDSDGASGTTIVTANNFGGPTVDQLHFIVVWHDSAANTINIQIDNGTPNSAAHTGGAFQGNALFSIGSYQDSGGSPTEFLDGVADEVLIYSRILTSVQKTFLYNSGSGVDVSNFVLQDEVPFAFDFEGAADFSIAGINEVLQGIRADLISYFPLDENGGEVKRDVFGANPDGAEVKPDITQTAAIITGGAPHSMNTIGGAGGHISVSSPTGLNTGAGSFTIGFWARIDGSLTSLQGGFSRSTPTGDQRQFSVFYHGGVSDTWRFSVSSDGSDDFSVNDDDVIGATGEVHFVLAWYDGDANTINIQLDDGTVLSAAGPSSVFNATGAHLDIAQLDSGSDNIFDGSMQDLAMWGRVLSADERTALYAAGAGVWLERFIPRNLQTFTDMWKFNETADVALSGVNGTSIPIFSATIGHSLTGHVEDPSGDFKARGDVDPLGAGTGYWAKGFVASDAFDIRGKVSCCWAGWFYVPSGITGNVNFLTIHGEKLNPGGASGQALITQLLAAGGGATSPNTFLEDGITPFSGPGIKADSTGLTVPRDTWQFMASGWDAVRNKAFCFWGRGPGDYHYSEVDGGVVFAATGFGYVGTGTEAGIGEYMFPTPQANAARFDQSVWFKGAAIAQTEIPRLPSIRDLWNHHVGTPQANMNFAGLELAFSLEADADFAMVLDVEGLIAFNFEADADFTMAFREVSFVSQVIADADLTSALQVRNLDLVFSFDATADFTSPLFGVLDGIGTAVDHYWKGEEASGTRFDELNAAGGSIDLTDVNTVGQAAGKVGNAPDLVRANSEELDGTASDLDFDGSADFAVLVWVAIDDNVSAPGNIQASIITKWMNPSDRGWGLVYDQSADAFQAVISTTGSDAFVASSATFISTALALVYMDFDSGTGVIRCSVNNGTKGTNTPGTTINQSTQILRVGSIRLGGSFDDFFDGVIDELIVFNRKLTDAELDAFHAGGDARNLRDFVVKDLTF